MANGEGLRVAIWLSGCIFHCKGCFNPQTWHPDSGKELTSIDIQNLLRAVENPYCDGLTLIGGGSREQWFEPERRYGRYVCRQLGHCGRGAADAVLCERQCGVCRLF